MSKRVSHIQGKVTEVHYETQQEEGLEDLLDSPNPYVPTLSPPSSFESFLLPLGDQELTAFAQTAVKASSSKRISSVRSTNESVVTDDFASAADNLSTASDLDDISFDTEDQEVIQTIYKNDILGLSKVAIPEDLTRTKMVSFSVPIVAAAEKKDPVQHFDVAEKVYEGVKTAWAFGKGFGLLKPVMNLAEGAAVKVLDMVTGVKDLETVDHNVKPHVVGIDREFLDPAILKVLELVVPLVSKGEELVKSIIGATKPAIQAESVESQSDPVEVETSKLPVELSPVKNTLEGVLPLFTPSPMKKVSEECDAPETSTPIAPVH